MGDRDLALDAIATFRLSRFVTEDVITRPVRARLIRAAYRHRDGFVQTLSEAEWDDLPSQDDDAPKLADFLRCYWCTSAYLAVAVLAARRFFPREWEWIARGLALSAAAALIAGLEQ